ncbi:MAG: hypothetical protein CBD18_02360 [Opitutales bacterium TMED158]|nr:MAG: hypothetical protein CBD18_02360 [Opitutales bacterium TMED158]|tara:strand:- start:7780 stop:8220 length:441 start_codon:yes stop_codon:yes gene_type:complete
MKTRSQTNKVILHCSATPEGRDITAADIKKWHLDRGWADIGYHFVVRLDGTIERGRHLHLQGAHTKGHNHDSIGICYIGGVEETDAPQPAWVAKDTMTPEQETSVHYLMTAIRVLYGPIPMEGHNEHSKKACPSFHVADKFPMFYL